MILLIKAVLVKRTKYLEFLRPMQLFTK